LKSFPFGKPFVRSHIRKVIKILVYICLMRNQQKAYFFALAAILCWSTIGSALKITLRYIPFVELLFWASLVSTITLFISLKIFNKLSLIKQLKLRDFVRAAFLGFLNPFLYYLVLLKAYDMLLAQEAGTLNYIWPVVLVLLSIPLLKQKIGWMSILAILISFAGTIIIGTRGKVFELKFDNPLGVSLALGSAVFWSIYWIFNLKDKKDEILKLFLNFCFGLLYIFIFLLITKGFPKMDTKGLIGSVYVGLFEMGITYILWLKGLQLSTTTAKVSNLVFISPFISLIIINFAVGEKIMFSTIAGLTLIVTGILMQQYAGKTQNTGI